MTSGAVRTTLDSDRGHPGARDAIWIGSDPSNTAAELAANGLRRAAPELSAGTLVLDWQKAVLIALSVILPAGLLLVFVGGGWVLATCLAVPFALVVIIRLAALWSLILPGRLQISGFPRIDDRALPSYSILVPLYREAEVAPALVQALSAIDYPRDRLEIIFLTEAADSATRAALLSAKLPEYMSVLTVPAGFPQTKPRALNYGLAFAHGDLIAVFDAEDVPAPGQLRSAAHQFAASSLDVVCVQARLSTYNTEASFLARQFALEYAALFEAILPALERFGLPMLLGGTSNHFRRAALVEAGGWDAYNVTEDADLGVRLARAGKHVAMLDSDTWEEAPETARAWLGQRTRWLKGWMQTYLVHMRRPGQLLAELGAWRFFGLQALLGGMILSALVHPWFYAAALVKFTLGEPVLSNGGGLWALCYFNLAAGYAAGIVLALVVAWRSHGRLPVLTALFVPVYWLAISVACYRALIELHRRPYYWAKTPHSARPVGSSRAVTQASSTA